LLTSLKARLGERGKLRDGASGYDPAKLSLFDQSDEEPNQLEGVTAIEQAVRDTVAGRICCADGWKAS